MWNSCLAETRKRAERYATLRGLTYAGRLGAGVHGIVLLAVGKDRPGRTAVKVHDRADSYQRERDCYLRLSEKSVHQVRGHHVPQMIAHDDELFVVEMTVVTRPYVLDFGGAYLDGSPDYPDEILADWQEEKAEQFESRWPDVQTILSELRRIGIHVVDVNPGNITFVDDIST